MNYILINIIVFYAISCYPDKMAVKLFINLRVRNASPISDCTSKKYREHIK